LNGTSEYVPPSNVGKGPWDWRKKRASRLKPGLKAISLKITPLVDLIGYSYQYLQNSCAMDERLNASRH